MLRFVPMLFMLLLAACSQEHAETIITEKNSGKTISIALGSVLIVALGDNFTTGYDWEVFAIDSSLLTPTERSFDPSDTLLGAPGVISKEFKAVGTGTSALKLKYVRTWQPEEFSTADSFVVIIKVQKR